MTKKLEPRKETKKMQDISREQFDALLRKFAKPLLKPLKRAVLGATQLPKSEKTTFVRADLHTADLRILEFSVHGSTRIGLVDKENS